MPRFDQTGPFGQGSRIGCNFNSCPCRVKGRCNCPYASKRNLSSQNNFEKLEDEAKTISRESQE